MENSGQVSEKKPLSEDVASYPGMNRVEALIRKKLASDSHLLSEIPEYLLSLGGKRIRPLLCLMTADSLRLSNAPQQLIDICAGIELIHMATLMHDDIIDKSPTRRHESSPYIRYGLANTLLAGDFLLVRAFSLCARLDRYIIDATEEACIELTEGEISETPLYEEMHTLESSLTIAKKKTASLFRLACDTASHIAGADEDIISLMKSYGESLGIAFQILDDILDVVSEDAILGKKTGTDIHERKPSAVNILWLNSGSSLAKNLSSKPTKNDREFVELALSNLRPGGADNRVIKEAKSLADSFAKKALQSLLKAKELSCGVNSDSFNRLEYLTSYVLDRDY